jgi:hypothetical protein
MVTVLTVMIERLSEGRVGMTALINLVTGQLGKLYSGKTS